LCGDAGLSRRQTVIAALAAIVYSVLVGAPATAEKSEIAPPLVVGWVERVSLHPGDITIPAKVDTGAVSCSLHAVEPERYSRDGREWVRFRIKDWKGEERTIERQIVGTKRIKRHFGGFQRRPVIRLGICLGTIYKVVDVNLVDRTGFEYPMLIGRNFMDTSLVVNPSVKHTIEPDCPKAFHFRPDVIDIGKTTSRP